MSRANDAAAVQVPRDFEPLVSQLQEVMPYFDRRAIMAGLLEMMAYQENLRQQEWIYALQYYGGKWVVLSRRGYVYTYDGYIDIVRKDTDATTEIGLAGALAAMRTAMGSGE